MAPEAGQEDLTAIPVIELVNRLADPNSPYAALDSTATAMFSFPSSHSPGSPLARELERRGIQVTADTESHLHFTQFTIRAGIDQLRNEDVAAITEQVILRTERAAALGAMPHVTPQQEILDPGESC